MTLQGKLEKKIILVTLFAVAMGFLEATVVVYMRELYYPEGFIFPLQLIPPRIFVIELVRELSTLIMLLSIGFLIGRSALEKFSWFLFSFGVWDIFYYVALKLFLDWPESLLTWDILFLIPIAWLGPVLAPLICSLTMIFFALTVFTRSQAGIKIYHVFWYSIFMGAILIFSSFIFDYTKLLIGEGYFCRGGPSLLEPGFTKAILNYVPEKFQWGLFIAGELLIIFSIAGFVFISKKKN